MTTVIVSTLLFLAVGTVMSVGVILGGSPLKGSCGGKGGPDCICDEFERVKCAANERMLARLAERRASR
ncbi:MAG: hypothetical protein ACI8S6_002292 [Myxococcota bacterium]|jgi:hypothetical protein